MEVGNANRGAKALGAACMQEGSVSRCLYVLEGAFPLESPLTIDHSRRMKGGSGLAAEALMGAKGPRVGRGLGLLGAVSRAEGSPQGPDGKPRGQPAASQGAQRGRPQARRRAARCGQPRG